MHHKHIMNYTHIQKIIDHGQSITSNNDTHIK